MQFSESKAAQQRTHSKTLRECESPNELRQVLECVRCCAALDHRVHSCLLLRFLTR